MITVIAAYDWFQQNDVNRDLIFGIVGIRMNVPDAGGIKVDNSDLKKHENYCITELKTFSSVFISWKRFLCILRNNIVDLLIN